MPRSSDVSLRGWVFLLVIAHASVAFWHGTAHRQLPVALSTPQQVFVAVVILLLPLVGLALLWSRRASVGLWIIAASLFASLLFGLINHFVLDSPDNVSQLPQQPARYSFIISAALVAATEAVGAVISLIAATRPAKRMNDR
jgi:hypothetical protein